MKPPLPSLNPSTDLHEVVQKILTGARAAVMLRLAAQTFSWVSTFIVVRFISPQDYGLNTMLEAPMALMLLVSTLGLDIALVQSRRLEADAVRAAFGWLLLVNGALFGAYFLGAPVLAVYFNEPALEPLARTLAFVFLLVPLRVIPNALLDRELRFKLKAQVELVSSVSAAVLTLTLAVLGAGVWALVAGLLANRLLQVLILVVKHPWFVRPSFDPRMVRQLVAFGGVTAAASAVSLFAGKLVHFIAGPELGAAQLGLFALSMQFALLPLAKLMPIISQILMPASAKFQERPELGAHYLKRALGIVSLALYPLMIGMACVADLFVVTVLGPRWQEAALPLALLSLIMPLRLVTQFIRPVMTGMGRPGLALKSSLVLLAALPPLALIGVNHGVVGLVWAWLVAEPIVLAATLRMSRQVLPIRMRALAASLGPAFVGSLAMAAAIGVVRSMLPDAGGLPMLVGVIALGATAYALALRLLFPGRLTDAWHIMRGRRAPPVTGAES